jgi:3-deoxy-7-phosphoheptulonate synthase
MIEVHNDPRHAKSDGAQSLTPADFARLMRRLRPYVELEGKTLWNS